MAQLEKPIPINPKAKAVMPDGKVVDRSAILKQLGLDPSTPPDAWLAVVACGSNAAALRPQTREQLIKKGVMRKEQFESP